MVQRAWQDALPHLLIFDTYEQLSLLTAWRPRRGGCRILLTSRRQSWDHSLGLTLLPLGILDRSESIAVLQTSGLEPNQRSNPLVILAGGEVTTATLPAIPLFGPALHLRNLRLLRGNDRTR
ncbi:MAG: hypothetical protein NVS4B8_06320 [Herpetosiphon sp.]